MNPCCGCYMREAEPYEDKEAQIKPGCSGEFLGIRCVAYYDWLKLNHNCIEHRKYIAPIVSHCEICGKEFVCFNNQVGK